MTLKRTFLWLIAVVALGTFYFAYIEPRQNREREQQSASEDLYRPSLTEVIEVSIERDDNSFRFERGADTREWFMRTPVRDRADEGIVNSLTKAISDALIERRFSVTQEELTNYGLSNAAIVRLRTADDTFVLHIGDLNPERTQCYATSPDSDEIWLVPSGVRRATLRTLFEFRSKRVHEFDVTGIDHVVLDGSRRRLEFTRTDDRWTDTERGVFADADAVTFVVRELRGLRASEISDDDAVPAEAAGTITLATGDDVVRYQLYRADDGRVLVRTSLNPRLCTVSASVLSNFDKTIDDFRDRYLLRLDFARIYKLEVRVPEKSLSVSLDGDRWRFANPQLGAVNQDAVLIFFADLAHLKAREITAETISPSDLQRFEVPDVEITLSDSTGAVIEWLRATRKHQPGSLRTVTSRSTGYLAVTDSEPIDGLVAQIDLFRMR